MKILYHHRTRAADGCRVHIEEMVASLRRLGHEVLVVAPVPGRAEAPEPTQTAAWIPWLRRRLPGACAEILEFAYSFYAFARLYAAFRSFRPDVLYERYNLFMPTGAWLRAATGLPVLLEVNAPMVAERSEHGGLALRRLADWSERRSWQSADRVLPVTKALADHLRAKGVRDERITVIPNGIKLGDTPPPVDGADAKARLGLDGKTVLGFVGFMREWHGLEKAVGLLVHPDAPPDLHLLLVGDGPARAGLELQAAALGVAGRMTITGTLPHEAVPPHLAAFDIAALPAVTPYASPLKLFEYLQAGRAIVAPDQPNLREILETEQNALLFDPTAPASFEAAVLRLCRAPALRARLGTAAAATIGEFNRTWDENAALVVRLAHEQLPGGSARAATSGASYPT